MGAIEISSVLRNIDAVLPTIIPVIIENRHHLMVLLISIKNSFK